MCTLHRWLLLLHRGQRCCPMLTVMETTPLLVVLLLPPSQTMQAQHLCRMLCTCGTSVYPLHFRASLMDRFNYANMDCSAHVHMAHWSAKSALSGTYRAKNIQGVQVCAPCHFLWRVYCSCLWLTGCACIVVVPSTYISVRFLQVHSY